MRKGLVIIVFLILIPVMIVPSVATVQAKEPGAEKPLAEIKPEVKANIDQPMPNGQNVAQRRPLAEDNNKPVPDAAKVQVMPNREKILMGIAHAMLVLFFGILTVQMIYHWMTGRRKRHRESLHAMCETVANFLLLLAIIISQ